MSVTKGVHDVRARLVGLLDAGGRALLGERGRRRRLVVAILGLLVLSRIGANAVFTPRVWRVTVPIASEPRCGMPVLAPDAPVAPMPVIGADPSRSFSIRVVPPGCQSAVAGGMSAAPRSRLP